MSDIRETLTNFTKNVTKSSGDLFKTTRLSMSVSTEQNNIKNLHLEIGKKVHEIYQYGGNLGKFFDEKYREIEACELRIEELKEQISQIKGTRECSKCGKSAERTAEFCPKCGIRMVASSAEATAPVQAHEPAAQEQPMPQMTAETVAPLIPILQDTVTQPLDSTGTIPHPLVQEAAPVPIEPPKTTRNCRVCGMENDVKTKFCLSCGRIVD